MANIPVGNAALNQPEAVHAGANHIVCNVSISATTSAGDVLRIGKLPHRAVPTDCVFYVGAALATNTIIKFGISASEAAFIASASFSTAAAVVRGNVSLVGLQGVLSRSDEAVQRFTYITCTPTLAVTAGQLGVLVVSYKLPGQSV